MSDNIFPKDENLRLVLSKEHQEWLDGQMAEARQFIRRYIIMITLCVVWLAGTAYFLSDELLNQQSCVVVPTGSTLEQLIDDGVFPLGSQECEAENTGSNGAGGLDEWMSDPIMIFVIGISVLTLMMLMASIVDIIRNALKLKEFESYTHDHQAFLEKYNRQHPQV